MEAGFKDADIAVITEAVSAATGKSFILDPGVRAQVTLRAATPISPEAFYEAFLSVLDVYGFNAEPTGDVIRIVPGPKLRQHPGIDLSDHSSSTSDELVTAVINVKNVSAAQLVPILRPMIAKYGHVAAHPASNILILSDRESDVSRMIRLIRRLDQVGDQDKEVGPRKHASAAVEPTGRQIPALAGLTPLEGYTLLVKLAGQKLERAALNEHVDLRRSGIEKLEILAREKGR